MKSPPSERTDVRAYIRPVLARWWLILAVVPLVTVGTYLYYNHKPKVYGASTQLFVQPSTLDQILLGSTGIAGGAGTTVENLALLIQTRAVGEQAARELAKEGISPAGGNITATHVEETSFIDITATAATPKAAAALANAYAKAFVGQQAGQLRKEARQTLETAKAQRRSLGNTSAAQARRQTIDERIQSLELLVTQPASSAGIRQVEPAVPPSAPLGNNPKANAIFAFVVSLLLAIGVAFGLEYLNRRLKSVEDVEDIFESPVLAEIPSVGTPDPVGEDGIALVKAFHEPFHRLQTNLDMLSHEYPLRTILVASAAPSEGKSTVARNLALAYREAGRNVAVLDADFRKATLGRLLASQEGPGLTDILEGRASFGDAVQEVAMPAVNGNGSSADHVAQQATVPVAHGEIAMVPAGVRPSNVSNALTSGILRQTLRTAADTYGTVIIDSSPMLAAADVLPLLSEVDGVLLVTRLGMTTRDSARRFLKELKRISNVRVVGVVVNGIPERTYRTRAYGYYYG